MGTIGERIRSLRNSKKMSLQELADVVGKSKGNIHGYENDKYEPSAQTIIALCQFFGVSSDWLLVGNEFQNQNDNTSPQMQLSKKEADLIAMFRELDDRDKEDAFDNIYHKYKRASKKEVSLYSTYGNESGEEMTPDIGKISNGNR